MASLQRLRSWWNLGIQLLCNIYISFCANSTRKDIFDHYNMMQLIQSFYQWGFFFSLLCFWQAAWWQMSAHCDFVAYLDCDFSTLPFLQLLRSSEGPALRRRRHLDSSKPYIAAKLASLPASFTLGDEKRYNGFYNKPLTSQQEYLCFVLAVLRDEGTDSSSNYVRRYFRILMRANNHDQKYYIFAVLVSIFAVLCTFADITFSFFTKMI